MRMPYQMITQRQIWKQRNDFIFDRGRPSFSSWKRLFMEEAKLQALRFSDAKRLALSLYRLPSLVSSSSIILRPVALSVLVAVVQLYRLVLFSSFYLIKKKSYSGGFPCCILAQKKDDHTETTEPNVSKERIRQQIILLVCA